MSDYRLHSITWKMQSITTDYDYKLRLPHVCFKVILYGNRCAAEIAKTPQCIYCYQMKPEFTCYNLFDNLDAIG
jgi:hypothetical protein